MIKAMEGFAKWKSTEYDEVNKDEGMENQTLYDLTRERNNSQQQSKQPNETSVVSNIVTEEHDLERADQIFTEQPSKDVRNDHCLQQNKIVSSTHLQESPQTESLPQDSVKDLNERECNSNSFSSLDDCHVENNDESHSHYSMKTSTSIISLSRDSTKQSEESKPCPMQNNSDLVLDQQTCPQLPPPSSCVSNPPPNSPLPLNVDSSSQPQKDKELNLSTLEVRSKATCSDSITSPSTASVSSSPERANLLEGQSKLSLTNESDLVSTLENDTEVGLNSIKASDDIVSLPTSSSSNEQDQGLCRIVTQYVFINRPHKKKSGKKKLGLVCKQGFRHYQRAKINFPSLFGKVKKGKVKVQGKNEIGNTSSAGRREVKLKKRKLLKVLSSDSEDDEKSRSVESKWKEQEPKSKKKDLSKKAAWKNSKKAERSGQTPPKAKSSKRRVLCDGEISGVKDALKLPGATIQSVSTEFGVAKTIVRKLWHEAKSANKKAAGQKRTKKKMTEKDESAIIIKEETPDDLVLWGVHGSVVQIDTGNKQEVVENGDDAESTPIFRGKFRRELTLDQKVMVIHELQKGGSKVTHVAKKYGISSSSVSRLNKHKMSILYKAESGDVCRQMKRTRDCKAPELDRALLKWYRSLEGVCNHPISMSNLLLREKSHQIARAICCTYLPTTNWILRWKYRHNILCKLGRIETREELDVIDRRVDLTEVISAVDIQKLYLNSLANPIKEENPDEVFVCEHCGVIVYSKKSKKRTVHLKDCPLHAHRRDLTLGEKVRVVRALEKPGAKMVHLAKKFSISTSAISRIHKDRIDILARYHEGYINMDRKRSRVSKEPEVEKILCDWYRMQQELGIHISSYMVREKAKEIAAEMGKDFSPSDSWVFRWRHRNNVNGPVGWEEIEDEDDYVEGTFGLCEEVKPLLENSVEGEGSFVDDDGEEGGEGKDGKFKKKRNSSDIGGREPKKRRIIFPRSVMCEKCGCVSVRLKNNRIRNMRHSKGCPLLKPRNEMTYQDRIKMLHELEEPGATLSSVARKYGVSTSSMSRMNQNKDVILNQGQERGGQKRIRDCKEPEVAKQLYAWYLEKQAEGIHVTGTKLKEKAAKMAKEEGRDFKVSTGWLGRWKNRYNIFFKNQNQNGREKVKKEISKRKTVKKTEKREIAEMEEAPLSAEFASHSNMSDFHVNDVAQTIQPPGMFFAQRYHQNPWDLAQQPATSCARPKSFIATVSHSHIPPEENQGPFAYDHIPPSRHMFHHTFETFALSNGYSVGMGVGAEPSMSTRDFLQADEEDVHHQQGVGIPSSSSVSTPSSSTYPSVSILHYPAPNAHLSQPHQTPSLLNHHHRPQHHLPLHQQHPLSITNIQQQQQHSSSPLMVVPEEDIEQDSQVMEAFKIMSSFAHKRSLGADVQAALRTIEMTMKGAGGGGGGGPRKGVKRNTYTNM